MSGFDLSRQAKAEPRRSCEVCAREMEDGEPFVFGPPPLRTLVCLVCIKQLFVAAGGVLPFAPQRLLVPSGPPKE